MYAILLDGETKSALAAARELGAAGISVVVGSEYRYAMAGYSRAATGRFVYPSPKQSQTEFVSALRAKAELLHEAPVVLAFSDASVLTLAAFADELKDVCRFVLPTTAARAIAFDKQKTAELARSLNIPTMPELAQPIEFPLVVKPLMSVSWQSGEGVFATATVVFDEKGYKRVSEVILKTTGLSALVQKFVIGPEYGVELMCKDGVVLLSFVHRRARSLSPRGGAATVKEECTDTATVDILRAHATSLAAALVWTGPLMVEFKYDEAAHTYRLMELNGRFWGSLPLPIAAGVPFVLAYVELVTGKNLESTASRRTHITRTQHLLGDCKWLLGVWFAHDRLRAQLYPSRLAATVSFLKDTLCTHKDVESLRDPLPFLLEIVHTISKSRL